MAIIGNLVPNPQPVNGTVAATQSGAWTVSNSSTAFKLQSAVRLIGAATVTLNVPAGQIFKGIFGGTQAGGGGYLEVRDTNSGGTKLFGTLLDEVSGSESKDWTSKYVELSAGTYFFNAPLALNQSLSVIGGFYANS